MSAVAFLFEGPCDGEVMKVADRAERIEIAIINDHNVHVYFIYSVSHMLGRECRTYKFQETIDD